MEFKELVAKKNPQVPFCDLESTFLRKFPDIWLPKDLRTQKQYGDAKYISNKGMLQYALRLTSHLANIMLSSQMLGGGLHILIHINNLLSFYKLFLSNKTIFCA